MKREARIYFSFRSPFSWLAVERLEELAPGLKGALEFIPYWEPDERTSVRLKAVGATIHYAAMSKAKHLYILHDVKRLANKRGLNVVWPVDVDPIWEVPHLAWLAARSMGRADAFYKAVVDARWGRGENICDRAVIRRLANRLDLDGELMARASEDERIREEGAQCLTRAYEEDIFGVPYMRCGQQRFWGADRVEDFVAALHIRSEAEAVAGVEAFIKTNAGISYDRDMPGGCG